MDAIQAGSGVLQFGLGLIQGNQSSWENEVTLSNNFSHMKKKLGRLHIIIDGVTKKLQKYWFPGNRIDLWLSEVKTIIVNVQTLATKFLESEGSSQIFCPEYDLIQKIDMECTNIDDYIQEGKEWEESLVKRGAYRTIKLEKLIKIANIQAFKNILDQLLKDLENDNFNIIKVHGEIGTGKSILVQHLNNCLANSIKMFDIVIFLPASRYRDENKYSSIEVGIQHIVAERLGLDIQGVEDVNFVAQKLRDELNDAKYLLLLDDVMETIELEAIGIPVNTKGSKIVYATSKIESKIVSTFDQSLSGIKVERLAVGDAWQLFENIWTAKNDTKLKGDIQRIACKVVNWCDGYFSLISLVAPLFKSKTSAKSWNKSLDDLRKPAKRGDIYMKVFENVWHLSYDGLEENQKICFLFSLLYPEEYKIPKGCLFDCWKANDLLGNDVIGEEMLDCLIEAALLNGNSDKQYVTIHKLCRGAALNILQKNDKFNCLVVEKELENVQDYSWEARKWISLADSGIQDLPENVNCPKLTTLFLQKNSNLKKIPCSFFDKMKELIVLDLYKAGFEFMLSMANFKKLKVLYVNGCSRLKELPLTIENHANMLEVLDLRGYIINEIPNDIKRLEHLRRLLVSIKEGETLNRLIISELSSLKELIIDVKSDICKDRNYMAWCNGVAKRIIEKIETFDKLTTLKFCFKYDTIEVIQVNGDTLKIFVPKQRNLQHIWNNRNLHYNALQVYIGFQITPNLEIPDSFYMYDNFVLSCEKIVNDPAIEDVLVTAKSLIMMNDDSLEHLDQIVVPHIHHLLIQDCNKIETLMHVNDFSNLQTLVLNKCSGLKALFLSNVDQKAMSIKYLEIRDCSDIEEINMSSTSSGDILPDLTTLVLHNLRMLTKICSGLEWPSLVTLEIHECPMLTGIPLNLNNANNMRHIKVEAMWWEKLKLDPEIKERFKVYVL